MNRKYMVILRPCNCLIHVRPFTSTKKYNLKMPPEPSKCNKIKIFFRKTFTANRDIEQDMTNTVFIKY